VLRETTSRGLCGLVCPSRTVVFITAVPITKLFAGVCVFITAGPSTCGGGGTLCVYYCRTGVCLLLQYLIQSCARGGRRIVEDMCYEIRRAEAVCVYYCST
jgi:hypothetical protein